ncbi:MAG: hypothetical protein H6738_00795 [Alphaproteobacteria bacterium]|nr:hypothetical protein [Alphaproteobacteria bacterium]MCB9695306.1 hypothetical protein [Alphaproteobacteria bacterium]
MLPLLFTLGSGCAYTFGSGLTAGFLDEAQGKGRSDGLEGPLNDVVQKELLAQLGSQLGQGLRSGVTEVTPEQQARLEQTIDALLLAATRRAGQGLRTEVSPELREMVQKDIVGALSEGMRGDLGDSLEVTVDRVVHKAVAALKDDLADEDTRIVVTNLIRDSVYYAMRENGATEGVGETLEFTLTENMLIPIQDSFGGMNMLITRQMEDAQRRTENTLKAVISALVVLSGVFAIMYFIRNLQLRRLEERNVAAERGLQNVDAALELLDPSARDAVLAKLQEYRHVQERKTVAQTPAPAPKAQAPSDDYFRKGPKK